MYSDFNDNNNNIVIHIGKKLYEEKDYPLESRIISEDKDNGLIQRESSWRGKIKGFNLFPDGNLQGSGISYINNKFIVIRTFFSNDVDEFKWLDGLVCIAEGIFDLTGKCYKSTGYEWTKSK